MKKKGLGLAILLVLALALSSLFVGAAGLDPLTLWSDSATRQVFFISRLPRTFALLLAGSAMSVAGLVMQLLTQNRFVEPSLAGTTQSASLGLLLTLLFLPNASLASKMLIACLFALAGALLFMLLLRRILLKSALIVPLLGIMLSAVIGAITVFIAIRTDLLQSLGAWSSGDFSSVLAGRYELLWLVGLLTLLACWIADRFTLAGLGRDFATNVGLNYQQVMLLGLLIIAIISGVVVVVVGSLPFVGLIIPNLSSLLLGDNSRKTLPWICLTGGGLVLLCDLIGRLIIYPFEIPVSTILSVIGALIFLLLLIKQVNYAKR